MRVPVGPAAYQIMIARDPCFYWGCGPQFCRLNLLGGHCARIDDWAKVHGLHKPSAQHPLVSLRIQGEAATANRSAQAGSTTLQRQQDHRCS